MNISKNRSGFTLIEIIIVIVILGVLATLSLPRLTAQTRAAEAAEAMMFFGILKRAVVDCYDNAGDLTMCDASSETGVTKPNPSKFSFAVTSVATNFIMTARRTANTAEFLSMMVDTAGVTQFAASAGGPFVGIIAKTGSTTVIAAAASTAVYP